MKRALTLAALITWSSSCYSQSADVHLSYPQIAARAETSSYDKLINTDTLLVIYDQYKEYAILKETKYRNDTIIKIGRYRFTYSTDTMDFYVESPKFISKFYELVTPIIDTISHPEDQNIIIRLDTITHIENDFAWEFKLDSTTYFSTIESLENLFKSQKINVEEIVTRCNINKVRTPLWRLEKEHFKKCDRIRVVFLLSKNGEMFTYPIMFNKTVANTK